ncbi:phosphotransferase family protein [Phaeacidiphilus oryzae]|uniref:phosphotransferase family protein n=1 Tax=Phaeacidiphilus oryzae TaxID=348818 RepID=UPI00055CFC91|nr:aminoglycoside phosphotransferase family protein [Phaeacidiphilus oryzae]
MSGFNNRNHAVLLPERLARFGPVEPGAKVKVRIPTEHRSLPFDQAIWPEEAAVLRTVSRHLPNVPKVLATRRGFSVQTFAEGTELAAIWGSKPNVKGGVVEGLASLFAALARIPVDELPKPPAGWPAFGDSTGFIHCLIDYTRTRVEAPAHARYGPLFGALGFPADALRRFSDGLPRDGLTPRPFVLLHADLHPRNLIYNEEDGSLHAIDWELAMVGDPVHDLAIHLCRTEYPNRGERQRFISAWHRAVRAANLPAVADYRRDLPWYVGYQRVRSVYTDVIRSVELLGPAPTGEELDARAAAVCRVLARAWAPVGLPGSPSLGGVRAALRDWAAERSEPGPPLADLRARLRRRLAEARTAFSGYFAGAPAPLPPDGPPASASRMRAR